MSETNENSARKAHEVAVQMLIHEGELVWGRFNVLLVAESVIAGSIGILLQPNTGRPGLRIGLSAFGIVLSIVWAFMNYRGFKQCGQYCKYLCEIETVLPECERFFHMAGQFAGRFRFSIRGLSNVVICAFALFFFCALWL